MWDDVILLEQTITSGKHGEHKVGQMLSNKISLSHLFKQNPASVAVPANSNKTDNYSNEHPAKQLGFIDSLHRQIDGEVCWKCDSSDQVTRHQHSTEQSLAQVKQ